MKKLLPLISCLLLIGCGEKKATGVNGAAGNDEGAGDPVVSEGEEAPVSPESSSVSLESRIIGYWTLDSQKSLKALESLPESPDSEEEQNFREHIGQAAKGLFLNFSKGGKVVSHEFDDPSKDLTYTIVRDDEEALSVEIEGFGNFIMQGDTLHMIPPEGEPESMKCILLSRIDAEEAQRHIEEAQSTKSIHRAAEQGDLELLEKHIAAGTDINTKDGRDGETPLHRAITRGQTEAARLLIEGGCDLNIGRTKDGDTPLDMAEGRGRTEIAELLREKGAKKSSDLPPVK